jgi:hypothetical protein
MRRARLTGTIVTGALLLCSACAGDLPLQERIVSTRPLAMRMEVLDPMADPELAVRAEALPIETVRVVPFVVDELGPLDEAAIEADIEPVWLSCPLQPIQGVFGCISSKFPLDPDDVQDCPAIDLGAIDPMNPMLPETPAPCWITGGTPARPEVQVPIDPNLVIGGDLEITMIGHVPGEGDTSRCVDALFGEADELPRSCIFVTQRAPVGPDTAIAELAAMFGIPGLEDLGPTPDEVPDADRNPRIQSFTVAVREGEEILDAVEVARGDTITVPAGATLEIVTEASRDDLQTYLIPKDNESFEERDEQYFGTWFRTWGDLLSPVSDDPTSMNTWTMARGEQDETDLPEGGVATMYYVLRDDRAGVDWWWFHVAVTP